MSDINEIMQFPKQREPLWADTARIATSQRERERNAEAEFEAAHPEEAEQTRKLVETLGGERACLRAWAMIRQAHQRLCGERCDRVGRALDILQAAHVQSATASNAFRWLQATLVLLVGASELDALRTAPATPSIEMPKAWDRRS